MTNITQNTKMDTNVLERYGYKSFDLHIYRTEKRRGKITRLSLLQGSAAHIVGPDLDVFAASNENSLSETVLLAESRGKS